ncbi:MAG TPA: threonine synthase [Candidatus Krumholzibacteria bacterium]
MTSPSRLSHLECSACEATADIDGLRNLCDCGAPWLARYDIDPAPRKPPPGGNSMWRYGELLPHRGAVISLGEGMTPVSRLPRLGASLGMANLWAKDESQNPTTSFKARGLSAAVTMAKALGAKALALPTAGNAGGALAAYGARAGLPVHVFMPADTPEPFELEARLHGAEVTRLDALIDECGARVKEGANEGRWFDVSTLKEPYRLEGKKTMGFEIAEQLDPLPEVVLYPTGGGTGLIGIAKAFEEMRAMGWLDAATPKLVAVQMDGCAPMVRAFESGAERAVRWEGAQTLAYGLRVPQAVGDRLILSSVRDSGGRAVSVAEGAMFDGMRSLAGLEGISASPEAGALVAAAIRLREEEWIDASTRVLLLCTGSWHKYLDAARVAVGRV